MRDREYEDYLDMEESVMDEEYEGREIVAWRSEAWPNRNEEDYNTVSVLPGCMVFEDGANEMVQEFGLLLGCKHPILIIGTATTKPDVEEQDHPMPESGGRYDFFFSFHNLDIMRVAIPRLAYGVRWWEDVVDNEWNNLPLDMKSEYTEHSIYPDYVFESIGYGSDVYGED